MKKGKKARSAKSQSQNGGRGVKGSVGHTVDNTNNYVWRRMGTEVAERGLRRLYKRLVTGPHT